MIPNFIKKSWFHILLWVAMFAYFIFAPNLFTSILTKNGKPIRTNGDIPADSNRITFVIDGFEPYVKDGENLYSLSGWALIVPEIGGSKDSFVRELALISDENIYFYPVEPVRRNPLLPNELTDIKFDLDTLGFTALISGDAINPGKYRIGMLFRDVSTGLEFYKDKPAWYLVKTPNTITLKK